MLFRTLLISSLCWTVFTYPSHPSDQKTLIDACKQETFHTRKPSSLDSALEKKIQKLKQDDPASYNQMLEFAQQKNKYKQLHNNTYTTNS